MGCALPIATASSMIREPVVIRFAPELRMEE